MFIIQNCLYDLVQFLKSAYAQLLDTSKMQIQVVSDQNFNPINKISMLIEKDKMCLNDADKLVRPFENLLNFYKIFTITSPATN